MSIDFTPLEQATNTQIVALEQPGAAATTNYVRGEFRHLSDLGMPGWEKTVRYGFFYFKELGSHVEKVELYFDGAIAASQTYSVSMLGSSPVLGTTFTLGSSTLGVLGAREQITKRVDMSGTAEYVTVGVRNAANPASKRFQCHGYEILSRPRRQVRRGA